MTHNFVPSTFTLGRTRIPVLPPLHRDPPRRAACWGRRWLTRASSDSVGGQTQTTTAPEAGAEAGPGTGPKAGPRVPDGFVTPTPRPFYVRPDQAGAILGGGLALLARLGSGATVAGYRLKLEDQRVVEYSSVLPRERPKIPLEVYEFEGCPFCRKVREAVSMLDLDAVFYPCPKGGRIYRPKVVELGGKAQFPYLVDPNTGFRGYESGDLVTYLFQTYSDGRVPGPLAAGPLTMLGLGLTSALRGRRGVVRARATVVPEAPLELWAYEASPFCRVVRERLCELELPYLLHTTARGSPARADLARTAGRFQVPYLVDPNTGVRMFESAEIVDYLSATYGPDAPGAAEEPPPGSGAVYVPPGAAAAARESQAKKKDEALEEYCEDNPEADECREYE